MFLNLVFLLHGLSSILFAVPLILTPSLVTDWLTGGAPLDPLAEDMTRLYGLSCVLIAVVTLWALRSVSSELRRAALVAMLVNEALGVAVSATLHFPFARVVAIVFYLIFVAAYVYVLLFRRGDI